MNLELSFLIQQRRSVKPSMMNGQLIPDRWVEEILESAIWAPTHGMTQPWQFTVFTGDGRQTLADWQLEAYHSRTPADKRNEAIEQKLSQNPLFASHIVAIGMKRQTTGKIPLNEEICAVAAAVQNMHLMAQAKGIAGFWSTGGWTYWPEAKEKLRLGNDDLLLGMFYLGYTDHWPNAPTRIPMHEKSHWVRS